MSEYEWAVLHVATGNVIVGDLNERQACEQVDEDNDMTKPGTYRLIRRAVGKWERVS